MTYTESEIKSGKFIIQFSIRVKGKRTISKPITIKLTELNVNELKTMNSLVSKQIKRSRKQA